MKELHLELTCIYARNYNLLLKIKEESEEVDAQALTELRNLVKSEMIDKQRQVIQEYCELVEITPGQFEAWVQHFENEDFIEE